MSADGTLTPDQVVSRNLTRARELRGWTQQKAAEEVSRHLGKEWSVPVYSAAERSHRTARVKEFSATEVVAFARAFGLPLAWFYLPPDPWTPIAPRGAGGDAALTGDDLLSLIFPRDDDPALADLEAATERLFSAFVAQVPRRENTAAYLGWVQRRNASIQTMLRSEFKAHDLDGVSDLMRALADKMDRALGMVVNDLRHDGMPALAADDRQTIPADSELGGSGDGR